MGKIKLFFLPLHRLHYVLNDLIILSIDVQQEEILKKKETSAGSHIDRNLNMLIWAHTYTPNDITIG